MESFVPEIGHGHYHILPLLWSIHTSLELLVFFIYPTCLYSVLLHVQHCYHFLIREFTSRIE